MGMETIVTKLAIKDLRAGRIKNIRGGFCIHLNASFKRFCKAVLYTPVNLTVIAFDCSFYANQTQTRLMGRVVSVLPGLRDLQLRAFAPVAVLEIVRCVERVPCREDKIRVNFLSSTSFTYTPFVFRAMVYYLRKAVEKEHFIPVVPEERHNEHLRWWYGNCLKLNLLN